MKSDLVKSSSRLSSPRVVPAKVKFIRTDFEILKNAPEKFDKLWKSIRKTDLITGGSLNMTIFQNIFEENRDIIVDILKIHDVIDFYEVFDKNKDSDLNEDEQILIFSVIKEKMQKCAQELLTIHEYDNFKEMMENIRKFELTITKYQDEVRQKIYKGQLEKYREIGENKMQMFYEKYDDLFRKHEERKKKKLAKFDLQAQEEKKLLDSKLSQIGQQIRVKPNYKLQEYKTQEKLFAIEERVAEAYNYRRELKVLEVNEEEKIIKRRESKRALAFKQLNATQSKDLKILQVKLLEEENNLILEMRREFKILEKQIHIHEREIKRIQNLVSGFAWRRGITFGELRRVKETEKQQNIVMAQSKMARLFHNNAVKGEAKIQEISSPNFNVRSTSQESNKRTIIQSASKLNWLFKAGVRQEHVSSLKNMVESKNNVNFFLRDRFGADKPINLIMDNEQQILASNFQKQQQIDKFLRSPLDKSENEPHLLSDLYDFALREKKPEKIVKRPLTAWEKKDRSQRLNKILIENY